MNARVVNLTQGSAEWLEHRKRYRNASETPAVMGVSPWQTPYSLWLERTGRAQPVVTPPMRRGIELEPLARAAYETLTGLVMEPVVLVDGAYSASLDGLTLERDVLLEVKCPAKGRESELWQQAEAGLIPEHYAWQLQHQLLVCRAQLAHFFVFDGEQGLLVEARPEEVMWDRLRASWDMFWPYVDQDLPPALTERDTLERADKMWLSAATKYRQAKQRAEEACAELERAKGALLAMSDHPTVRGGGVQVTRFWKTGNVDYKRVPELKGVNLDRYRGPMREEVRLTLSK